MDVTIKQKSEGFQGDLLELNKKWVGLNIHFLPTHSSQAIDANIIRISRLKTPVQTRCINSQVPQRATDPWLFLGSEIDYTSSNYMLGITMASHRRSIVTSDKIPCFAPLDL